jgi:predicted RNA-binding protein YlqC (UPF0109 family)
MNDSPNIPPSGRLPMKELLETIVRSLVDNPSEVSVREVHGEKSTILELKVFEGDVGKVIGKQGRIINALRTILRSAAVKEGKIVQLELL